MKEYTEYLENPETRYFIIDTHGGNDPQNIYEDKDFLQYAWKRNQFNKVREGDLFIYRRPSSKSELKEFYFFGAGIFGIIEDTIDIGDAKDKHVVSHLHTTVRFDEFIKASDKRLLSYKWQFKDKVKRTWGHFFNQYGMTQIVREDFLFLLNMGVKDEHIGILYSEEDKLNALKVSEENETIVLDQEGKKIQVFSYKYERKPELRMKALDIHGYTCKVCNFDFSSFYGDIGKEYIEVHHVKPLSAVGEEHTVNPETDLVPVCANCHRMIHRKSNYILSIEELKQMISQSMK